MTVNDDVLLELGRTPLNFDAKKFSIKNWERIIRGGANAPLLASFRESVGLDLPWTSLIKASLENIGMLSFYNGNHSSKAPFVFRKFFQRLCDVFHQDTFAKIQGNRSKLRTYAIFKKDLGYEKYLTDIKNVSTRISVTKFRLSNHKLMIETGRHKKMVAGERFCPFCPESVEDEVHFLFSCPTYRPQRLTFLTPITNLVHNFPLLSDDQKLEYVMSYMDQNLCNFISDSMNVREFLVNKPKRRE